MSELSGAEFSEDRTHRYALWRIWDKSLPMVMFVGLNPSTANENANDATIRRVCQIAKNNRYGGVYMCNCFSFISTDPAKLYDLSGSNENLMKLGYVAAKCKDVVFAWGNFSIVRKLGIDYILAQHFPDALALHINKNGSPKHPLYCKADSKLIKFKP